MSNLLSNLIAKTTETAVTLQPRPHALFEAAGPAAMPSLPIDNPETAESTPQTSAPLEPPRPMPAAEMKPASAQPRSKPVKQNQPEIESPPARRLPAHQPLAASQPPALLPAAAVPEPAPVSAPDHSSVVQPIVVEKHLVKEQLVVRPQIQHIMPPETAVPTVKTTKEPNPQAQPNQPNRLDSPPVPPLPKTETPPVKSVTETIRTTIITALAGPKAAPRRSEAIIPAQAVPHIPSEQKRPLPETTPEPVIQVHIGRIEVRATPPETRPSPKKQRQLPVMGLDDYLRQRNGQGGKR